MAIPEIEIVDKSFLESDPSGKNQHEAGAKLDDGKVLADLVLGDFARALWAVAEVGTFGAKKYTKSGWLSVPDGLARYEDAQMRHRLKRQMGELVDDDSDLLHRAHEAWNALATLELHLREQESDEN